MFFETLNQSLESQGLVDHWDMFTSIGYGETVAVIKNGLFVSIFRETNGRYEEPVFYETKSEDRIIHYGKLI